MSGIQTLESRASGAELEINEKQLVRKIDWRILPVLCAAYIVQFMDKVVLNYANVMGIRDELHMELNEFVWAGTAFFLGYILAEIPQGIVEFCLDHRNCKLTIDQEYASSSSQLAESSL
jgi:hypothetical protein